MREVLLEKARKIQGNVQIERYEEGTLGIILSKTIRDKFDEVFKGKLIDVFVGLGESDKRMIIEVRMPKEDYIA